MDNETLKEELQILSAARLAGSKAPEDIDNQRAREFVHGKLNSGKKRWKSVFTSRLTYSIVAVAACAVIALLVFTPSESSSLDVMQQESIHAAIDTVDQMKDSLEVNNSEAFELTVVDE